MPIPERKRKKRERVQKNYEVVAGKDGDPIEIGPVEIPCYVLEGEIRVITKRGMEAALGLDASGTRLRAMVVRKSIKSFLPKDFSLRAKEYHFKTPNGVTAHGYEATTLATIIEAVLASWQAKKLHHSQMHIVGQCALLSAGFMRAGIVALIDEHTGYEKIKIAKTVRDIMIETCVSDKLVAWYKQVPNEWWEEMLRVCGVNDIPPTFCPIWMGKLFKRTIWDFMPDGVYETISGMVGFKETANGNVYRENCLHQHLTPDCGLPQYQALVHSSLGQLRNVPTPPQGSSNWGVFFERWQIAQGHSNQLQMF